MMEKQQDNECGYINWQNPARTPKGKNKHCGTSACAIRLEMKEETAWKHKEKQTMEFTSVDAYIASLLHPTYQDGAKWTSGLQSS